MQKEIDQRHLSKREGSETVHLRLSRPALCILLVVRLGCMALQHWDSLTLSTRCRPDRSLSPLARSTPERALAPQPAGPCRPGSSVSVGGERGGASGEHCTPRRPINPPPTRAMEPAPTRIPRRGYGSPPGHMHASITGSPWVVDNA